MLLAVAIEAGRERRGLVELLEGSPDRGEVGQEDPVHGPQQITILEAEGRGQRPGTEGLEAEALVAQ